MLQYSNLIIMKKQHTKRSGFTLIELLTVIAIIGILAAILIPAVGKVREVANKSTASSNMRSIAVSYATYSQSSGRTRVLTAARLAAAGLTGTSTHAVADFLAQETDLLDATLWRIDTDTDVINAAVVPPPAVGVRDATTGVYTAEATFAASPVSYDFMIGVGGNDQTTTTPLLVTRGLQTDGTWDGTTPWGGGGHIAFLDAHVTWYNALDNTELGLVNISTGALTVNYTEAVNSSAVLYTAK
jgi:prepilin-type N-terminal cleavage/methylation domain-containing protein/prepilin-type processing-associated H-X9-DG protein